MLIIPKEVQEQNHKQALEGIINHFNDALEKILVENSDKDTYWILGKTRIENVNGKDLVRPFLQACVEKPGLVKESFVYEVDNRRGVKTLLWVMHPDGKLSFPTLGKSISVAGSTGVKSCRRS